MAFAALIRNVIRQLRVTVRDQVPALSPLSRCAPKFGGTRSSSAISITDSQASILRRRATRFPGSPLALPVSAKVRSALCEMLSISTPLDTQMSAKRQVSLVRLNFSETSHFGANCPHHAWPNRDFGTFGLSNYNSVFTSLKRH